MVSKSAHQESKVERERHNSKVKIFLTTETSADTAALELQRTKVALPSPHYLASTCSVGPFHLRLVSPNTFGWLAAPDHCYSICCSGFNTHKPFQPTGFTYILRWYQDNYCILRILTPSWCPWLRGTHNCWLLRPKQGPGFAGKEQEVSLSLSKSLDYLTWLAGLRRGQETELGPLRYHQYHPPSSPEQRAMGSKGFVLLGFHLAKSLVCHVHRASLPSLIFLFYFFSVSVQLPRAKLSQFWLLLKLSDSTLLGQVSQILSFAYLKKQE